MQKNRQSQTPMQMSFVRHGMVLLLITLIFFKGMGFSGLEKKLTRWVMENHSFIGILFALSVLVVLIAPKIASAFSKTQLGKDVPLYRLLLERWRRCPKCLSWWGGLLGGAALAFFYWKNMVAVIFWGAWTAFFCSSLVLAYFFFRREKET